MARKSPTDDEIVGVVVHEVDSPAAQPSKPARKPRAARPKPEAAAEPTTEGPEVAPAAAVTAPAPPAAAPDTGVIDSKPVYLGPAARSRRG